MNIEVTLLISLAGLVLAYLGYRKGAVDGIRANGETDGAMKADIQYIRRLNEDILLEQREARKTLDDVTERVIKNEESIKSAHKRIDRLERGIQ